MANVQTVLLSFLLTSFSKAVEATQCFTPNGTEINDLMGYPVGWLYQPCNNYTSDSMCCAIGPGMGNSKDICLPNGLCQNRDGNGNELWWRESCTDQTWKDSNCVKLFVNGTGLPETEIWSNLSYINDVQVTPCSDNKTYCYGFQNHECCEQDEGVYISNGQQYMRNPEVNVGDTPHLSTKEQVAIAVPVTIVGLFLLVVAFLCFRRDSRRRRRANRAGDGQFGRPYPGTQAYSGQLLVPQPMLLDSKSL